ncbi:Dihydropteroate synthase [Thermogutta terrifontis]|uniref:Dihydropteroate synthase n=1 Tax=Thermogutta terrifontis TaxID=1331910 RepID=A0A286RA80_9BACT|nr:dihydropteroate synthase [Thermogutta terrifontis]ASV72868.1 Dihydropteroate synthase [Thermogutta terrifontis]
MADIWSLRSTTLSLARRPLLMGILNVTPDSFSDGGLYLEPSAAIERGLQLAEEGADIIDVGGESTRPGAQPVSLKEELRRVLPVITALVERVSVPLSIDTSKAVVAREALAAGVQIVNDVTALRGDPTMLEVVTEFQPGVCLMHMRGTPQTMQQQAVYQDVVEEVRGFLRERCEALKKAGIPEEKLAIDPGLGFAKTPQHNWQIIGSIQRFRELGYPLVVGHSRKRFIREITGAEARKVIEGTLGVSLLLAAAGVDILRIHDVGITRRLLDWLWKESKPEPDV